MRKALLALLLCCACQPAAPERPQPEEPPPGTGEKPDSAKPYVTLGSVPFYETSTLQATVHGAPPGKWVFRWYVNGVEVPAHFEGELTGRWFSKGDTVTCLANQYAGATSTTAEPASVRVTDSPPALFDARIAPGAYLPWDEFRAEPLEWDDADGDPVHFEVEWRVNGIPAFTGSVFRSLSLVPGDLIEAALTPHDGEESGSPWVAPAVTVAQFELPVTIVSFTASPAALRYGERARLDWQAADAAGCTLDGSPVAEEERAGGTRFVAPEATTTFTLRCRGGGAQAEAATTVTVGPPPASINSFAAEPAVVQWNEGAQFSWSVARAAACKLDGFPTATTGAQLRFPAATTFAVLECLGAAGWVTAVATVQVRRPIISEVAWMGTTADPNDEWIELYNAADTPLSLAGWKLEADDGLPVIALTGTIAARGYFLLERTNDDTAPGVAADQIYTGSLGNTGERLRLLDPLGRTVDQAGTQSAWPAGDITWKATLERLNPLADGSDGSSWSTATVSYGVGLGSPRAANSRAGYPQGGTTLTSLEVRFTVHAGATMPNHGPGALTTALTAFLDSARSSIYFGWYDLQDSPELIAALARALARGVLVRGVLDSDAFGRVTASDAELLPVLPIRMDGDDRLVHDKYVVVDGEAVWTGSANFTDTDLNAEYNCNVTLLVRSAPVAAAYTHDFEELFAGRFHRIKRPLASRVLPRLPDGTYIEAFFPPADDAVHGAWVRAIDAAAESIDAVAYAATHADIEAALLRAKVRGVGVRLILDATGAASPYSIHRSLRAAGVAVKTENWGGKAHAKLLVADGYTVVLGSQNWTQAGQRDNDENVLYIENRALGAAITTHFEADWWSIPEAYGVIDPPAEGAVSAGSLADMLDNDHDGLTDEGSPENIVRIDEGEGAVNLYFSKAVLTRYARAGNAANGPVNLASRFVARLNAATQSVDAALYELTLPEVTDALMSRAAAGVRVRLVVDGKDPPSDDPDAVARYTEMRVLLERLARGSDGIVGTADDAALFADSPVFAVTDASFRIAAGLPADAAPFPEVTVAIGSDVRSGRRIADAETKPGGSAYYAAGEAMHHKFAVIDERWTWTGSWNPTVTGTYGSAVLRDAGILGGSADAAVEVHDRALAGAYAAEFDRLWQGRFHGRKGAIEPVSVVVGGRPLTVYFGPGARTVTRLAEEIARINSRLWFLAFAFSHQALADALKVRFEGSTVSGTGVPTGFEVRGLFDVGFWDAWWSASTDMRGIVAPASAGNPNTRWANRPAVRAAVEDRHLHAKVLMADDGGADPWVAVGSTNFSEAGDGENDDNTLVIHDAALVNQFRQFFEARWVRSGGGYAATD